MTYDRTWKGTRREAAQPGTGIIMRLAGRQRLILIVWIAMSK